MSWDPDAPAAVEPTSTTSRTSRRRSRKAGLSIAAGFLLADTLETVAARFPKSKFAITDYCARARRLHHRQRLKKNHPNVMGLDFAANESGCLVGYLAAEMAKKQGGKQVIGAVGGLHIPPVDIWIAGYQYCAKLFNPQIKVLTGYSRRLRQVDLCKTVAENQIAQGAQVLFQVAGGCGLGTLTAAAQAGIWGIGVDKDQYNDAKRVLTSGVKRVDLGVLNVIKATKDGKFKGDTDLQFTLANGGMSVGKINPAVPQALDRQDERPQAAHHLGRGQGPDRALQRRRARAPARPHLHRIPAVEATTVLEMRGITKRFPGVVANDHVDFDLRAGEVHALLGENGAGKSTLMNILYGLYRPTRGRSSSGASGSVSARPKDAIAAGIGMVHQHFMLIPVMTVAENIVLANEPTKAGRCSTSTRAASACASCRRRSASQSTPTPGSRTSASASSSGSRS